MTSQDRIVTPATQIGTSGWVYPHWRALFYPPGLPESKWLAYYAGHFGTVEVNYSFYRLPTREALESWRAQTPPEFSFAVKGSRFVTHFKKLREPARHIATFFERVDILGEKLGPVLWQLPPQFRRDEVRLEVFLDALPRQRRQAIEFRDASWLVGSVYQLLGQYGVALCLAHSPGRSMPAELTLTTNWTYLRFHYGSRDGDYTEEELRHWAGVIDGFSDRDVAVYAYFNNDWHGFAIKNALRLGELLAT
jgi:uncharacterized protein YecE (DUF72 family)